MAIERKIARHLVKTFCAGLLDSQQLTNGLFLYTRSAVEQKRLDEICKKLQDNQQQWDVFDIGKLRPESFQKAVERYNQENNTNIVIFPSRETFENGNHFVFSNTEDEKVLTDLLEKFKEKQDPEQELAIALPPDAPQKWVEEAVYDYNDQNETPIDVRFIEKDDKTYAVIALQDKEDFYSVVNGVRQKYKQEYSVGREDVSLDDELELSIDDTLPGDETVSQEETGLIKEVQEEKQERLSKAEKKKDKKNEKKKKSRQTGQPGQGQNQQIRQIEGAPQSQTPSFLQYSQSESARQNESLQNGYVQSSEYKATEYKSPEQMPLQQTAAKTEPVRTEPVKSSLDAFIPGQGSVVKNEYPIQNAEPSIIKTNAPASIQVQKNIEQLNRVSINSPSGIDMNKGRIDVTAPAGNRNDTFIQNRSGGGQGYNATKVSSPAKEQPNALTQSSNLQDIKQKNQTQQVNYSAPVSAQTVNQIQNNTWSNSTAGRHSGSIITSGSSSNGVSPSQTNSPSFFNRGAAQQDTSGFSSPANVSMNMAGGAHFIPESRAAHGMGIVGGANASSASAPGLFAGAKMNVSMQGVGQRTGNAVLGILKAPVTEIWNTQPGRELRKYTGFYQLGTVNAKAIAGVAQLTGLKSEFAKLIKSHEFVELNSFLTKNSKAALDAEKGLAQLKDTKKALAQLGIKSGMSNKDILNLLKNKYGITGKQAKDILKALRKLSKFQNTMKMAKKMATGLVGGAINSMVFIVGQIDDGTLRTISSVYTAGTSAAKLGTQLVGANAKMIGKGGKLVGKLAGRTAPGRFVGNKVGTAKSLIKAKRDILVKNTKKKVSSSLINPAKKNLLKAGKNTVLRASNTRLVKPIKGGLRSLGSRLNRATTSRILQSMRNGLSSVGKGLKFGGKMLGKAGKVLLAPFKMLFKFFDLMATVKKWIIMGCAAYAALTVRLILFGGMITIILNVICGFFTFDLSNVHDPQPTDSICGQVYTELKIEEKKWVTMVVADMSDTSIPKLTDGYDSWGVGESDIDTYIREERSGGSYAMYEYKTDNSSLPSVTVKPFFQDCDAYRKPDSYTFDGGDDGIIVPVPGDVMTHTSNIRDILAMSGVYYTQNFDSLKEDMDDDMISNIKNVFTGLSNAKKNLKNTLNRWLPDFMRLDLLTVEDLKNLDVLSTYAKELFANTHRIQADFEMKPLPTFLGDGMTAEKADEMIRKANAGSLSGKLTICTHYAEHGCCEASFYINDEGYAAGSPDGPTFTNEWNQTTAVYIEDSDNCFTGGPDQFPNCWVDEDRDGIKEKHHCAGGHTGHYCGGHLQFIGHAQVLVMATYQIEGEVADNEKIPESSTLARVRRLKTKYQTKNEHVKNPLIIVDTEEKKNDTNGTLILKEAADIFEADECIFHENMPKDWVGWTPSNIIWAGNLFNQDWWDLYHIHIEDSIDIGFSTQFNSTEIAQNMSHLDGVHQYTPEEIQAILSGKGISGSSLTPQQAAVVAEAYSWVGKIGYDQLARGGHSMELRQGGYTDCTGFVCHLWMHQNPSFGNHTSHDLYTNGAFPKYDIASAEPGDILIKDGHAMLFISRDGNNIEIIHSTGSKNGGSINGHPTYNGNIYNKTVTLDYLNRNGYKVIKLKNHM